MKEEGCVNLGTKAESRRDVCKVGTTDVCAHSARARCEIAQEFQGPRGCGKTWDQPLPSLWIFQGNWVWVGYDSTLELRVCCRQTPCFQPFVQPSHETRFERTDERAFVAMECRNAGFSLFPEFVQDSVYRPHNNLDLNLYFEALDPVL